MYDPLLDIIKKYDLVITKEIIEEERPGMARSRIYVADSPMGPVVLKMPTGGDVSRERIVNDTSHLLRYGQDPHVMDVIAFSFQHPMHVLLPLRTPLEEIFDKMSLHQVISACSDVAGALDRIHNDKRTHSDLHSRNIYLNNSSGQIADFELAQEIGKPIIGFSPGYLHPEQMRVGPKHAERFSDLWGLGVILFQTLTGTVKQEYQWLTSRTISNKDWFKSNFNRIYFCGKDEGRDQNSFVRLNGYSCRNSLEKKIEQRYRGFNGWISDQVFDILDTLIRSVPPYPLAGQVHQQLQYTASKL
jgi:serine/threonine protein kinase